MKAVNRFEEPKETASKLNNEKRSPTSIKSATRKDTEAWGGNQRINEM